MESPRQEDRFLLLCAGGWGTVTCPGAGMQLVELTHASNGLLLG